MWNTILMGLLLVASAGACMLPVEDGGTGAAKGASEVVESEPSPDASFYPICVQHYSCCADTKLGDKRDGPRSTRCQFCSMRCHDSEDMAGRWPRETHAGRDCQYWKPEYYKKRLEDECSDLPR